jgi:hypothetical protein
MGFADITNTVLDFVRQHPNWAAFVVFAPSFGESIPFSEWYARATFRVLYTGAPCRTRGACSRSCSARARHCGNAQKNNH